MKTWQRFGALILDRCYGRKNRDIYISLAKYRYIARDLIYGPQTVAISCRRTQRW